MSSGFKPVYRGTAVQFKEDFSNVREVAMHVGGYIITNGRSDGKPSIYMPDNNTLINGGQYVLTTEDGEQTKMYQYDYEEMFGKPEADEAFVAPPKKTRIFHSYLKMTLKQAEINAIRNSVQSALDATVFKQMRRNRALNHPIFKRVSEIYSEATGYPMTLEAAKNIFDWVRQGYHKEPNGRFSFILAGNERVDNDYFFYVGVDAKPEEVQASRNMEFLEANPEHFANYKAKTDYEEYA